MRWVNGWVASGLILAGLAVPSAGLANQQAAAGPAQSGPNGTELPAGPTHPDQPAGPAGPVELSQPWATPAPLGGDSNVMFTLRNYGDVRDDLLHAACATAGSTELVAPAPQGGAPTRDAHRVASPRCTRASRPDAALHGDLRQIRRAPVRGGCARGGASAGAACLTQGTGSILKKRTKYRSISGCWRAATAATRSGRLRRHAVRASLPPRLHACPGAG